VELAVKLLAARVAEPPGGAADRLGQERPVPRLAEAGVGNGRFAAFSAGCANEGAESQNGGEESASETSVRSRHERLLWGSRLAKQLT
jgi:hypothetical protein